MPRACSFVSHLDNWWLSSYWQNRVTRSFLQKHLYIFMHSIACVLGILRNALCRLVAQHISPRTFLPPCLTLGPWLQLHGIEQLPWLSKTTTSFMSRLHPLFPPIWTPFHCRYKQRAIFPSWLYATAQLIRLSAFANFARIAERDFYPYRLKISRKI